MSEEQNTANKATKPEVETEEKKSGLGKMGKIFLLAGIVLVQAVGAYAIVNGFYPSFKDLSTSFSSNSNIYYGFDNIIINPSGSNGKRYLILSISVELNSSDAASTIDTRKAEVQDRINTVISNYTSTQLNSLKERDTIKKNIGIAINKVIHKKAVRNLFFTKYVLQ